MVTDEEFWRLPKVIEKVGMSRAQIYRRVADGTFPRSRSYRNSTRSVFWLASEVRDWQQQEVAAC